MRRSSNPLFDQWKSASLLKAHQSINNHHKRSQHADHEGENNNG
jgi:hypothetical protein